MGRKSIADRDKRITTSFAIPSDLREYISDISDRHECSNSNALCIIVRQHKKLAEKGNLNELFDSLEETTSELERLYKGIKEVIGTNTVSDCEQIIKKAKEVIREYNEEE